MVANESIIYGKGHGGTYADVDLFPADDTPYFPNSVVVYGRPKNEDNPYDYIEIGIQAYDANGERRTEPLRNNKGQVMEWSSMWTDLDREGINRLIRDLRKARDKAFGKDE